MKILPHRPSIAYIGVKMKFAQILRLTAILLASSTWLQGADFIAPAEGPVPFRRDQIPLDVPKIAELSNQLESLVLGLDRDLIEHRRAAAQMLALATALDPSNTSARQLITDFQLGNSPPNPQAGEIATARTNIRTTTAWLKSTEAGPNANNLAACLADVLAVSDPQHPESETSSANGESGQWAKWVPTLAAYERKEIAPAEISAPLEELEESPAPTSSPSPVALATAEIESVLWTLPKLGNSERETIFTLVPATLKVQASSSADHSSELSIRCEPAPVSVTLGPASIFQTLLKTQNPDAKLAVQLTFSSPAFAVKIDRENPRFRFPTLPSGTVNAAAATLAHAAITGQVPDATIIGLLNEQGEFIPGDDFWDQIMALSQNRSNAKRLIIPTTAEPSILAILALEKSGFFFDFEVISASNFTQLLALSSAKLAAPEAAASAKFHEIREKSLTQATARYVSNPYVRRRLAELATTAPHHLSAKMLGIQGSGKRPLRVHRQVIIPMLRKTLEPIGRFIKQQRGNYLAANTPILRYPEPFREALAQVEPYVEKSDLPLFAKAQEVLTALRALERASRAADRDFYAQPELENALSHLITIYQLHAPEFNIHTGKPKAQPGGD